MLIDFIRDLKVERACNMTLIKVSVWNSNKPATAWPARQPMKWNLFPENVELNDNSTNCLVLL